MPEGNTPMTSTHDESKIRVSSPGDLVELVPYLLGFGPTESLVVIGLAIEESGRGRVTVSARADLPDGDDIASTARQMISAIQRQPGSTQVALLLFSDADHDRLRPLAQTAAALAQGAGLEVLDLLLVDAERWWSLQCEEPGCCPPEGTPRTGDSRVAAEAVLAGLAPLTDRAELGRVFEPIEPALDLTSALARGRARREAADPIGRGRRLATDMALFHAEARRLVDDPDRKLTAGQLARLGVALTEIKFRDEIWMHGVDDLSLDGAEPVLRQLMTRLPGRFRAAPLFLYGWLQWRRGEMGSGTRASMAADKALEADPGYSAAKLLDTAVQYGMNPRTTPLLDAMPEPQF
jgi:hypothetical protein